MGFVLVWWPSHSRQQISSFLEMFAFIQVCNFQSDCQDGSDEGNCVKTRCTFNSGDLCNWYVDNPTRKRRDVAYTWLAQQGSTGTAGTGPTKDHTTGTRQLTSGYFQ